MFKLPNISRIFTASRLWKASTAVTLITTLVMVVLYQAQLIKYQRLASDMKSTQANLLMAEDEISKLHATILDREQAFKRLEDDLNVRSGIAANMAAEAKKKTDKYARVIDALTAENQKLKDTNGSTTVIPSIEESNTECTRAEALVNRYITEQK